MQLPKTRSKHYKSSYHLTYFNDVTPLTDAERFALPATDGRATRDLRELDFVDRIGSSFGGGVGSVSTGTLRRCSRSTFSSCGAGRILFISVFSCEMDCLCMRDSRFTLRGLGMCPSPAGSSLITTPRGVSLFLLKLEVCLPIVFPLFLSAEASSACIRCWSLSVSSAKVMRRARSAALSSFSIRISCCLAAILIGCRNDCNILCTNSAAGSVSTFATSWWPYTITTTFLRSFNADATSSANRSTFRLKTRGS